MIVMKLCGLPDGRPTEYDGEYLENFDFMANDGQGVIMTTPNLYEAKKFKNMGDALSYYRTSPLNRLLRPDGKPNRPLTGWNWEFADEKDMVT